MTKKQIKAIEAGRQVVNPEWRIPPTPADLEPARWSEAERMGEAQARKWEEEG